MRNQMVAGAVTLSLLVTGGLTARIVAINKPAVIVILIPALAGAFIAIRRRGRIAVGISALLTALTAMTSLIGGEGLLYVPSIVLFIWGATSSEPPGRMVVRRPLANPHRCRFVTEPTSDSGGRGDSRAGALQQS
jgi:hypothetical protein